MLHASIPNIEWNKLAALAATLGALASAALFTYRWIYRRFLSLTLDITFPKIDFIHVTSVTGGRNKISISTVGRWIRIVIMNSGNEPQLITAVRAFEEGGKAKDITALVKNVDGSGETIKVSGSVSLPFRVEHHDAVTIWAVADIQIPEPLGKALGEIYGVEQLITATHTRQKFQNLDAGAKWIQDQVNPDIKALGLRLGEIKLGPITVRDPLIDRDINGNVQFRERLAHLSPGLHRDLLRYAINKQINLPSLESTPSSVYVIEVLLNNGKVLRRRAKILDALWFMDPDKHLK